jgi:hypothetical protein
MKRPADWEVITIVNMVRMCQKMNTLPSVGGLLDQDAYFVYLLNVILAADEKRAELDQARAKAGHH